MRGLLVTVALLITASGAHADTGLCKAGEAATLEGEIIIPPVVDAGEWFWPGKFANRPCRVTTLRGKGALPAECVPGKRMTLSGHVTDDGVLTLQVTSMRCY
ncbi:MAG TPA: hypothetical protein PL193_14455 [Xanthobacteraceae bacterium]|nr:hypothetical protein [Xanthobacteraceae bacterium]